jgi:hypothetical protein
MLAEHMDAATAAFRRLAASCNAVNGPWIIGMEVKHEDVWMKT